MKWPSVRFFQAIGLGGFSLSVYNTLKNNNKVGTEKMEKMDTKLDNLCNTVEKYVTEKSKDDKEVTKEITESIFKKVYKNADNTAVTENLESARSGIIDLMKVQEQVAEVNRLIKIEKDPTKIIELQKRLDDLNIDSSAAKQCVSVYDKLNNINTSEYVSKPKIARILEDINNSKNKFTDDLSVYIDNFNEWMHSLNYEQNIALINLFGIFVIMTTLVSIITIFYGNLILDYFNLEQRYPKIAKIINLRRKFQQFYLMWNIIIISIVSIIMFLMNLTLFY